MGPHQDVDAVDLVQCQPIERTPEVAGIHPPFRPGPAKPLGAECDAAGLRGRKPLHARVLSGRPVYLVPNIRSPASPRPGTM